MKKWTLLCLHLPSEMVRHLIPRCFANVSKRYVYQASSFTVIASVVASDIIELSSGDEDALQISSESADEDADGTNGSEESSGAHINDALNLPDAQGRVLVNINHPAEEKDLYLAPQLAKAVKPHQVCPLAVSLSNLQHMQSSLNSVKHFLSPHL